MENTEKPDGKTAETMILYHTGFEKILVPDVHRGRKNADFGEGFYLTTDPDFAHRWAKERKGKQTIVNTYELDLSGLSVKRFTRDQAWFDYIFANRYSKADPVDADVIIGPIANDTIYDAFGIITSGYLEPEAALELLRIGPEYQQAALKTEKAAASLKWLHSETVTGEQLLRYRETVAKEETAWQAEFSTRLAQMM